jgi:hypothetical protein
VGKAVSAPLLRGGKPGKRFGAVLGYRGASLGHLPLQRDIPGGVPNVVSQQTVTLSHRLFVGQNIVGMVRCEAQGHAVKETAAAVGAFDPETVLRGHQPDDAYQASEGHLWRRFLVDPHGTGRIWFSRNFDFLAESVTGEVGADLPADSLGTANDLLGGGAAQAAPGGEERNRLHQVGLARAVGAEKRDGTAIQIEPRAPVAAKMRKAQMGNMRGHGGKADTVFLGEDVREEIGFPKRKARGVLLGNLEISRPVTRASASRRRSRCCRHLPS